MCSHSKNISSHLPHTKIWNDTHKHRKQFKLKLIKFIHTTHEKQLHIYIKSSHRTREIWLDTQYRK